MVSSSLNCQPGQRAWINITPLTPQVLALGIDRLHGHVVEVLQLHPKTSNFGAQWVVDPPQWCVVPRDVMSSDGRLRFKAGLRFNFEAVPDMYLRPMPDFPPEEVGDEYVLLQLEGLA